MAAPNGSSEFQPVWKNLNVTEPAEVFFHRIESSGNVPKQQENREDHGAEHQHDLDQVRPHDRFDSAHRRINRGDDGDENDAPDVGIQTHRQRREKITPDDHHDRAAEVEADADSQHAGEEENPARHVLGLVPKRTVRNS